MTTTAPGLTPEQLAALPEMTVYRDSFELTANAALIALAPTLAAEVLRLTAEVEALRQSANEQRAADYQAWQEAEYRAEMYQMKIARGDEG